ncbi:hypothetical protein [Beijerinckia indica]|uniref:hypothetical protein n=1 Tax=Beijerinckia indica TaxID=533 RepID=UPI000308954F|nr:hypothetical protein [Beijerinckia indica]
MILLSIYYLNKNLSVIFSVDDPYIHLALAENISHLHYGINVNEFASPSSSIIWPFLIAPFAGLNIGSFGALLWNIIGLGLIFHLWNRLFERLHFSLGVSAALAMALTFLLNGFGLVFTGMENTLHVAASLAVVIGLIETVEDDRLAPWLIPAAVCSVLLRFEGAGVAIAAACALFMTGHKKPAVVIIALTALCLFTFSVGLTLLGLPPLPSSVLAKLHEGSWFRKLTYPTLNIPFTVMIIVFFTQKDPLADRKRLALFTFAFIVGLGHILAGGLGAFRRYEIYAVTTVVSMTIYFLFSQPEQRKFDDRTLIAASVLFVLFCSVCFVRNTVVTPFAASDIYNQQYQMGRFAKDYWREPIGVNDLGWTSYQNPYYVLDLWGLGSNEARAARFSGDPGWMQKLTAAHKVGLAMVYSSWFYPDIPPSWSRIAELRVAGHETSISFLNVEFYLTDPKEAEHAYEALAEFKKVLPERDSLDILPPERKT